MPHHLLQVMPYRRARCDTILLGTAGETAFAQRQENPSVLVFSVLEGALETTGQSQRLHPLILLGDQQVLFPF